MSADEYLKLGQVDEALRALKEQVKERPDSSELRIFLFQMFCIIGDWDRASKQLEVLRDLAPTNLPMVQTYQVAIQCERLRESVFRGERGPQVLGDPPSWLALLMQTVQLAGAGNPQQAAATRDEAFDAAPTQAGSINGEPFEWLADGDSRIGPLFEVVLNGQYFWVPLARIQRIAIEPPTDLRDLVWLPAEFVWDNDGTATGLIPVRYPGAAGQPSTIQLARITEWDEPADAFYVGRGQRVLTTDQGEYSLLDVREIDFQQSASSAS